MRRIAFLVMAAVGIMLLFASIGFLLYAMLSDPFGDGGLNIVIIVALFFVMMMLAIALITFGFVKYFRNASGSSGSMPTKICTSCGETLDVTELTCHRCFAIQPAEDRTRRRQ
ncbi:MAG: hypothetical protein LBV13_05910 [Methanomassiliicoccaceae archaeon]|jgi:hypothetical protein|nr:hypothetical protein [Methanomassiliicoccaceae archaeon]